MNFILLEKTISWWQAIILGIIQGLGEFLPISSSGHLAVFEKIFGIEGVPRLFDVCLHVGTLAATLVVFRREIMDIIKRPRQRLTLMIIIATVLTVIVAVVLELAGDKLIGENVMATLLGFNFMITGILLYLMELVPKKHCTKDMNSITVKDAAIIGAMQGVGTLAGISRSGSTISTGVFVGINRKVLARFSFLISVPSVIGAFFWDLLKFIIKGNTSEVTITVFPVILGVIAAGIVGYLAIRWMLNIIANKSVAPFAYYTFALGLLVSLDTFFTHIIF